MPVPAHLADLMATPNRSHRQPALSFGLSEVDAALGGGLEAGSLHEVFAARSHDAPAATALVLALLGRAAIKPAILWARPTMADTESGRPYALGLAEMGLDPGRIVLVSTHDPLSLLRASADALRSGAFGAVLLEIWTNPKILDLTATRRLFMAAEAHGVTAFLLRAMARPAPSAAMTRWSVRAVPSQPRFGEEPGHPVFEATLLRHRGGVPEQTWRLEWDRDEHAFKNPPLHGPLVPKPAHRPRQTSGEILIYRRAG